MEESIYHFLTSLPKIQFMAGKQLYHGTNCAKIVLNNHDKLFMSLNPVESIRHALKKKCEEQKGKAYLHTFILTNSVTIIDFTGFTQGVDTAAGVPGTKWDAINKIVDSHLDNYQMEQLIFDVLNHHPELMGYYDGHDQGVVVLVHPLAHFRCMDVKYIKSLISKGQNKNKIKIKTKTACDAYNAFNKYYIDLYINRSHPEPINVKYDH